jgi:hypothetical protein
VPVGELLARVIRRGAITVTLVAVLMSVAAASAAAAPVWRIASTANTSASPGGTLQYFILATNVGDPTDGATPYTMTIDLPTGVTGVSITPVNADWVCSDPSGASSVTCTNSDELDPGDGSTGAMILTTAVASDASGDLVASASITDGGAAAPASTVDPTRISDTPAGFGIDGFDAQATDSSNQSFTQAGGHPYAYTTNVDFDAVTDPIFGPVWPAEPTKDVIADLPVGFIGNPGAAATCSLAQLATIVGGGTGCPAEAQVGVASVTASRGNANGPPFTFTPIAIYNMAPPPDAPARFAMNVLGAVVTLDASLRSQSDYGLSVNVRNISEGLAIIKTSLVFWGTPGDPSHDAQRYCLGSGTRGCVSHASLAPLLRNPTACTDPGVGLPEAIHADSWTHPGAFHADGMPDLSDPSWKSAGFVTHDAPGYPALPSEWGPAQGQTGCAQVPFDPVLTVTPGTLAVAQPSGFAFDLALPQNSDPTALAEGDLEQAVVTLPAGVRLNPASAMGLAGCSPEQIGLTGTGFPAPFPIHFSSAEPSCPGGSRLGSVEIDTPLLKEPLRGSVYLASPHENPFGSLVALYLLAKGPGVELKLAGRVHLDPATGQLTATFAQGQQLPFEHVRLLLEGGPRAPFTMPPACGAYTTRSLLSSWSGKTVASDSSFTIAARPGGPCPTVQFNPSFTAGTVNPVAGAFSPLSLQLVRTDQDSEFASLSSLALAPGLLADVGSVTTRCTDAQAAAAACPAASHIGEVSVGAGAGPTPFYVGGDVYLTGPYKGNPFGVAVVVRAIAGPFDLGYVVVKGAIQIHDDGSVTVATDPFPTILQGIPLQIRDVRVNLDRPRFMFNPTSCDPMSIDGRVVSTDNQQAGVSSRFQVGECANLTFKPSFTVSTAGKTSKASGASLHVHLATHEGPSNAGAARESNIAKVDVQLPVVLPARLPTLQKACTAEQFGADPAGCPVGSFVGTAIAHTPILASPLSGPAILVSHGGQAFPDLVLVLQGEGVRINLTGHTQIKKGITYNHFETVPDAPVSSFDLTLPSGPHGVLTTDIPGRNLCATTRTVTVTKRIMRRVNGHTRRVTVKAKKAIVAPLLMPTTMTAQNGAVIHQNTKIAVTGCAAIKTKGKKATKKQAKKTTNGGKK